MTGSEKQIEWAEQIKQTVMDSLGAAVQRAAAQHEQHPNRVNLAPEIERLITTLNTVESASWWIDESQRGVLRGLTPHTDLPGDALGFVVSAAGSLMQSIDARIARGPSRMKTWAPFCNR